MPSCNVILSWNIPALITRIQLLANEIYNNRSGNTIIEQMPTRLYFKFTRVFLTVILFYPSRGVCSDENEWNKIAVLYIQSSRNI